VVAALVTLVEASDNVGAKLLVAEAGRTTAVWATKVSIAQ